MDSSSAQDPRQFLGGLDFPASKLDAIATAEANGAPQEFIESLQALDQEQIDSPDSLAARR
jgi:hypothetical protein